MKLLFLQPSFHLRVLHAAAVPALGERHTLIRTGHEAGAQAIGRVVLAQYNVGEVTAWDLIGFLLALLDMV